MHKLKRTTSVHRLTVVAICLKKEWTYILPEGSENASTLWKPWQWVLLCCIDPRVGKNKNKASSYPVIFSRTLRFYYNVASSPGSPLPHLLDGQRDIVGSSAIPASSCPGPVRYSCRSIIELKVPPDKTPGLMTPQPHNIVIVLSLISLAIGHHTLNHTCVSHHKRIRMQEFCYIVIWLDLYLFIFLYIHVTHVFMCVCLHTHMFVCVTTCMDA